MPGVAGVDEAGRGPLAGPVVAAAVILPEGFCCDGIADSKKLNAKQREAAEARIRRECAWAIGVADVEEIDRINILQATLVAMRRAVEGLGVSPKKVIVDGNRRPRGIDIDVECIVGGDTTHAAISAASILAKTYRDRIMIELDGEYPVYNFAQHKGYGTAMHRAALEQHGPCEVHRKSFEVVLKYENRLYTNWE